MAGAASLSGLALATGGSAVTGSSLVDDRKVSRQLTTVERPSTVLTATEAGKGTPAPGDGQSGSPQSDEGGEVRSVACDSAELVAALTQANAEGGGALKLAPKCTYVLAAHADPGDASGGERSGLPVIYQPISIEGADATIARDATAEEFRFFTVRDGGELKLSNITLTNGRAASGGGIRIDHGGNAVVEHTTFTDSAALAPEGGGGGIFNDGHLTLTDSKFANNSAAGWAGRGGGLLNGGVLTVKGAEFTNNRAGGFGGGFANYQGAADISESTFAHNTAGEGGGIASVAARTKVWQTKVTANTARVGGGVVNKDATITLRDLTISHNTSEVAGGGVASIQGLLTLDDSTVTSNTTGGDGGGISAEQSNVLVRKSESSHNQALGPESKGGGIAVTQGQMSLFKSKVIENRAAGEPGGLSETEIVVKVDDKTVITGNRPCGDDRADDGCRVD
ncbi:parallel beta helix pectate lyase-like protein [Micromonospora pisi]|uniref:Parallel beta helix pectate lyase-like protein n=1 Tax=Micromonospora pisi TaxID=589240 RepID=A0A495JD39_9ACTN|nr:right-handed parallel beta-helix repeat-containing protein [Micromonospora pisi]RKR86428.1 parallel beta helix pectate lyase-like protein [Micromonospora pisi]